MSMCINLDSKRSTNVLVMRKSPIFDIESIYVLKLFAIMCKKDTIVRHAEEEHPHTSRYTDRERHAIVPQFPVSAPEPFE